MLVQKKKKQKTQTTSNQKTPPQQRKYNKHVKTNPKLFSDFQSQNPKHLRTNQKNGG
jgi:hypothetical protein